MKNLGIVYFLQDKNNFKRKNFIITIKIYLNNRETKKNEDKKNKIQKTPKN